MKYFAILLFLVGCNSSKVTVTGTIKNSHEKHSFAGFTCKAFEIDENGTTHYIFSENWRLPINDGDVVEISYFDDVTCLSEFIGYQEIQNLDGSKTVITTQTTNRYWYKMYENKFRIIKKGNQ